ncbi:unnamed protein product [Pedinophyceae sp. YPF-701]|nr:unnamed protein product [Pedinophyceae sp. YPF-701]
MPGANALKRLRWVVDIEAWRPSEDEWNFYLRQVPLQEQEAVLKFKKEDDRKRALVSRLLQRCAYCTVLGLPATSLNICRTKGRKPFLRGAPDPATGRDLAPEARQRAQAPNFNLNISHEGALVVLASEPVCLVGVDVAAPWHQRPGISQRGHGASALRATFEKQLTEQEWRSVEAAGSPSEQEVMFQTLWSLKEAFVKARGDGLAFDFHRASFRPRVPVGRNGAPGTCACLPWTGPVEVEVDGVLRSDWALHVAHPRCGYAISVARGPPTEARDAWGVFRGTFLRPELSPEELEAHLGAEEPAFTELRVEDLLPEGAGRPERRNDNNVGIMDNH